MGSLRQKTILVAHQKPELRAALVPLLRRTAGHAPAWAKGKKFRNPETGNKVTWQSLPSEEQSKLRKNKGEGDSEGDSGDSGGAAKGGLKGFLAKVVGLSKKGIQTITKLPEKGQRFCADPEHRKAVLAESGKAMKASPKKYAKEVGHHFKHEVQEIGGGLKRMASGQMPTKGQSKAMAGMAIEVAVAGLMISTAGTLGAGGALVKSLAKHLALAALNPLLGDAYVFGLEGSVLVSAVEGALKVAGEKGSTDPDKFMEDLVKAVGDSLEKGISEEAMVTALNGGKSSEPSDKESSDKESSDKALREGMIHLAQQQPGLRVDLIPLLREA